MGMAVENRQKERLGKIHELVIDAKEGRMASASSLFIGGYTGMGNEIFVMI